MIPKLKLNLLFLNVKMVKILKFKRRLKNLTNYYKRKVYIESGKIRLVVRISNKHVVAQLIKAEIKGDVCLSSVHSSQLKEFGWIFSSKNLPACYILGYMLGKKAILTITFSGSNPATSLGLCINTSFSPDGCNPLTFFIFL